MNTILYIMGALIILGMIGIIRELRKINVLMEKGAKQIQEYVSVVLMEEAQEEIAPEVLEEERQQAAEEKRMLFSIDPEAVLEEFMGDIL
ncbi:hypothetical protein SAMN02910358_01055 [Lachnospiraceae bacterium XBB1006]|nr:hypothetical protein SAMN02910358_01055 [Lachnospiraceae bacterium XBB1006]